MKRRALIFCLILAAGCAIRPAQDRAELDREVGEVRMGGVTWSVDDGLAQFVESEPSRLVAWAQAPALDLETSPEDPDATDSWELELRNVMPDGELVVVEGNAQVTLVDQPLPTRQIWRIESVGEQDARFRFAPPDADAADAWRFAVLSDVQEALPTVGDIFERINRDASIRFVVSTGDITDIGSTEELARFKDELQALDVPFYSTVGNHEEGSADRVWTRTIGRANFNFRFKDAYFSFIDSGSATIDPIVYGWLEAWLDRARSSVHVFVSHIPPIDPMGVRNGSFRSRQEAAKLQQLLAEGNVDLALHGHVHSYYLFERAGVPSYISGGGGAIPERFDGIGRHYLVVDVSPDDGIDSVGVVRVD
jgi:predicted phosphodiesterase